MIDYRNIIKNREIRLQLINLLRFIPDTPYLKMVYYLKTGKRLNLDNPTGFNEKENWLKLHDQHPEYTDYVDKVKVRDVVEEMIGPGYFFPLLGVWDHFNEIDFDSLPTEFVLKCNHDSGSVKIIRDKSKMNKDDLNRFFEKHLKLNPFYLGREYPYKYVKPCILAEKLMGGYK